MRLSRLYLIVCLVMIPALGFAESNYYLGASGVTSTCDEVYLQETRTTGTICAYDTTTDRYCTRGAFTASGSATVKNIGVLIKRQGSGAQTVTVTMCDADGTSNCVVWDDTISIAAVGTEDEWVYVGDAAGKAITAASTYMVILTSDGIGASDNFVWGYNGTGSNIIQSNREAACAYGSWDAIGSSEEVDLRLNTCETP